MGENQVNTEVHIPHITLILSSQRLSSSYSMRCITHFFFCLIIVIILKILAAILFPQLVLNSSVTSSAYIQLHIWEKHILLIYCLLISPMVSFFMWCRAGRQKASTLPSNMPAWKIVWSSLLLRTWTAVPRALPSNLLLYPREQGTTCSCSNLPPAVPVTSQHRPTTFSSYQLARKGEGQWFLLPGKGVEKVKEILI